MGERTIEASMRNGVTGEITPLDVVQSRDPVIVEVPVLGHVVIGEARSSEPIVCLAEHYMAALAQPGDDGEPRLIPRDVVLVDDDSIEVELLPNSSGEDRLVACVKGMRDG